MLITATMRIDIRLMFFSTLSCFHCLGPHCLNHGHGFGFHFSDSHINVVDHDQHATEKHQSTEQAQSVIRVGKLDALNERVGQRAVVVQCTPHKPLRDASDPHRHGIEDDTDRGRPEMYIDQLDGMHCRFVIEARDQAIQSTYASSWRPSPVRRNAHARSSSQCSETECIDRLDRHHRPFEGRHAVERQGDNHEFQNWVRTQFMPSARQGHDAVDHAAPGWR